MWVADLQNGNYRNPVLYADYSDPDAIRVGEDYFMIASSFSNSPALPVLHSKDLVNWKVINYCLKHVPEFRYNNPLHGCGVWAPSIRYHEGTYYVCFPMPDEGIYMTTTKDPWGEWSKPVNIRPGAGWIDPCPFWDDDGKAYLVAGVAKSRIGYKSVLHIVRMQPDGMGIFGDEVKIFDGNENDQITIEGPKMYKRNGYYYVFAPAGGVKTGWQTVLRSKNPFGPYEYKVVLRQGDSPVNGPHQGAWVDTVTGEDWFLHFQDVYAAGRITHLQPMHWENDWPIIGVNKEGNDYGEPVMEYRKPDIGKTESELEDKSKYPVCEPDTTDEFDSDALMLQWQWNANYDDSWFDTKTDVYGNKAEDGSYIKLNAVPTTPLRPVGDYRNLLLQKWPAPEFTCVTKMSFNGLVDGDYAGMISLGVDYAALGVAKKNGSYFLRTVNGKQNFDCESVYTQEIVDEKPIEADRFADDTKTVYLRYTVKRTGATETKEMALSVKNVPVEEASLEISFDGKAYENAVSYTAKAGRWVGVKNGMFVSHDNTVKNEENGFATVDYIRYSEL
ncbi:MAG: glycoside hydrolase 43 family protein [Lachnospira sp.]|jgi:glycoside hydrolase family 43